ncbi:MAG: hypothetical protein LBI85_06890 [Spirochaetaceae bacterium]|nr:hypothetical protein [Spirochaetaceae bacterium]
MALKSIIRSEPSMAMMPSWTKSMTALSLRANSLSCLRLEHIRRASSMAACMAELPLY